LWCVPGGGSGGKGALLGRVEIEISTASGMLSRQRCRSAPRGEAQPAATHRRALAGDQQAAHPSARRRQGEADPDEHRDPLGRPCGSRPAGRGQHEPQGYNPFHSLASKEADFR
jgi:hypothetical protein